MKKPGEGEAGSSEGAKIYGARAARLILQCSTIETVRESDADATTINLSIYLFILSRPVALSLIYRIAERLRRKMVCHGS